MMALHTILIYSLPKIFVVFSFIVESKVKSNNVKVPPFSIHFDTDRHAFGIAAIITMNQRIDDGFANYKL